MSVLDYTTSVTIHYMIYKIVRLYLEVYVDDVNLQTYTDTLLV